MVSSPKTAKITQLLIEWNNGRSGALQDLLPLVYGELRKLAAHKMAQEQAGQTLQPTALVHEAWLRIIGQQQQRCAPDRVVDFHWCELTTP